MRRALTRWITEDGYTHAITLNTDRELSLRRMEDIFSTFCHVFDKRVHRIRNMQRFPSELRLRAVVFPEHLTTNAHLHGLADLGSALNVLKSDGRLKQEMHCAWKTATRGSGSVDLGANPDRGWSAYSTKDYDGTYMLAAGFHPH